jgi:chromosome segregation ATPase
VEVNVTRESMKGLVGQLAMHKNAVLKIERELQEAKGTMERYIHEYDTLFRDTERMTEQLEKQLNTNKHLKEENADKGRRIAERREELKGIQREQHKLARLKRLALQMLEQIEAEREGHEKARDQFKVEIARLASVEIKSKRKECETQRVQIDEFKREKEILNRKLSASKKSVHDVQDIIVFNQSCMKVLQNEISGFQAGLRTQRDQMNNLLSDKEKHEAEAEEANRRYFTALEHLKLQDTQIRELQKQIQGCTSRLKQQQNLYEAVRSDRNLYSKQLLESQQEIEAMKSKFKIMNHQIEQLKEEIIAKVSRHVALTHSTPSMGAHHAACLFRIMPW